MKYRLLILILFVASTLYAQVKNPYLSLKYDKVIMYDFSPEGKQESVIFNKDGNFVQAIQKEVILDIATAFKLNNRLGAKNSYGSAYAMCFDPHLGFVYFLEGIVVAQITVCFSCNALISTINIPAQEQGKQGEGKEAFYLASGLSKSFRDFLNGLVLKNRFSHQIEPGSGFDQ